MGESATRAGEPTLGIAEQDPLLDQSWSALEVLANALGPLEPLDGASDLSAQKERLEQALRREDLSVQLAGPCCAEALEGMVGVALLPPRLAEGVTMRL